ncbi:FAD-dependent monooxygenase [Nocardia beijingensis]|uniref:FAD-dependent monooxygenase n=1 Tax=Nocardia beijingensis TaxID=95162 RepID=UPI0033DA6B72
MTGQGRSAIVAGGGIGGLAAAIGLHRSGWAVTVLERRARAGEIGAGWSFAPNAVRAADALGVGADFRAVSVPTQAGATLRAPSGRYLMRYEAGRDVALLANHRADLHSVLLSCLPTGIVQAGAEVTGYEQSGSEVSVTYRTEEGTHRAAADVLVGADGIHSAVRRGLWADSDPVFQRILCWRGVTEPGSVWPVEGFQTWGRGARFGAHPLTDRRVFWFLTVRQPEPGIRYEDDRAELLRRVGDWHDPIPALLAATTPEAILCHDIFDIDPLPSFAQGRVVLLGDAAHAMTPFLAQGACQALEDATVLAAELRDGPVPAALARFDQLRRPRGHQVQRMARQDPAISLSTNAIVYGLATGLTRLAGRGMAGRKSAALWEWTPPTIGE